MALTDSQRFTSYLNTVSQVFSNIEDDSSPPRDTVIDVSIAEENVVEEVSTFNFLNSLIKKHPFGSFQSVGEEYLYFNTKRNIASVFSFSYNGASTFLEVRSYVKSKYAHLSIVFRLIQSSLAIQNEVFTSNARTSCKPFTTGEHLEIIKDLTLLKLGDLCRIATQANNIIPTRVVCLPSEHTGYWDIQFFFIEKKTSKLHVSTVSYSSKWSDKGCVDIVPVDGDKSSEVLERMMKIESEMKEVAQDVKNNVETLKIITSQKDYILEIMNILMDGDLRVVKSKIFEYAIHLHSSHPFGNGDEEHTPYERTLLRELIHILEMDYPEDEKIEEMKMVVMKTMVG